MYFKKNVAFKAIITDFWPGRFQVEILHRWKLYSPSRQPASLFDHPYSKKHLLVFRLIFLVFNFSPLPLVLSKGTTEKGCHLPLHFLQSGIYTHWWDLPESLLFFKLNSSSSFSLFSQDNLLIIFVAICWSCSIKSATFLYWGTQNWKQYSSSIANITFTLQNKVITLKLTIMATYEAYNVSQVAKRMPGKWM